MKQIIKYSATVAMTFLFVFQLSLAQKPQQRPNIVLIMADDMGYECLGSYGSLSYETPNLDRMAQNGIRFEHCISQPLCTPSRVKIMTGKYNYRNYEYFDFLNPNQKTFGNYLQEAGYKTCVVGKWQLNGIYFNLPGSQDIDRPYGFGFDEYCLWQLNKAGNKGERYANPLIIQNGKELEGLEDSYGPDVFCDYICDYIERADNTPFFIYYPMVLVHDPFVPTPDSPEWKDPTKRYKKNKRHFKDMVEYTDKIVGRIEAKLKEEGLLDNTLLIFTGDNGTHVSIDTRTKMGTIKGGKSYTIDAGCHVPLIVSWPDHIKSSRVYEPIVGFHDFLPTFLETAGITDIPEDIDGKSFYNVFKGLESPIRENVLVHYDPMWMKTSENRDRYALTTEYKLYRDGRFFHYINDLLEINPIITLTSNEKRIKRRLQKSLDKAEKESPWIIQGD